VVFQKLASNGDFRNWEKNTELALVFASTIKGIKNGKVRIIDEKMSSVKRKGSRNTPLFNP
jgi:hypothetical protein